jgi:hypothetical protein
MTLGSLYLPFYQNSKSVDRCGAVGPTSLFQNPDENATWSLCVFDRISNVTGIIAHNQKILHWVPRASKVLYRQIYVVSILWTVVSKFIEKNGVKLCVLLWKCFSKKGNPKAE